MDKPVTIFGSLSKDIELDDRELATVLAALRYWQRCATVCDPEFEIAADGRTDARAALTADEIDALCERLNCGE